MIMNPSQQWMKSLPEIGTFIIAVTGVSGKIVIWGCSQELHILTVFLTGAS